MLVSHSAQLVCTIESGSNLMQSGAIRWNGSDLLKNYCSVQPIITKQGENTNSCSNEVQMLAVPFLFSKVM
jgi:hypothetical protein